MKEILKIKNNNYFNTEFANFITEMIDNSQFSLKQLSISTSIPVKNIQEYKEGIKLIPSDDFSLLMKATNTPKNQIINFLHDLYVFGIGTLS